MLAQTYLKSKSGKARKASHRLNDLKINLDDDQEPRKLLVELPVANFNEKEQLRLENIEQFPKWLFYLKCACCCHF